MLTANNKCSCYNREIFRLTIQKHLSEKSKALCGSFIAFLGSTLNFKHFEK